MRTAKENARRIRGGARIVVIASAAAGLTLVIQAAQYLVPLTLPQLQYLIGIIDATVAASFVAAGVGLWLVFTALADEVEAGA